MRAGQHMLAASPARMLNMIHRYCDGNGTVKAKHKKKVFTLFLVHLHLTRIGTGFAELTFRKSSLLLCEGKESSQCSVRLPNAKEDILAITSAQAYKVVLPRMRIIDHCRHSITPPAFHADVAHISPNWDWNAGAPFSDDQWMADVVSGIMLSPMSAQSVGQSDQGFIDSAEKPTMVHNDAFVMLPNHFIGADRRQLIEDCIEDLGIKVLSICLQVNELAGKLLDQALAHL